MKRTNHRYVVVGIAACFLSIALLPALDLFMHPFSVLYSSDYEPLIVRLPHSLGECPACIFASPVLVIAVIVLGKHYQFGYRESLLVLLAPFLLALIIEYLAAVQLDKYFWYWRRGYAFEWRMVLQFPFMADCLWLTLIYAATCSAMYWIVTRSWNRLSARAGHQ